MKLTTHTFAALAALVICGSFFAGCANPQNRYAHKATEIPPPPARLGYSDDPIWRRMEANAEAVDFMLYENDFAERDDVYLNTAGKDHLKQIAARLHAGAQFPVLIERSFDGYNPRKPIDNPDVFNYPIHPNPELDNARRDAIARVLAEMGVPHADQRVFVSTPLTPGQDNYQALRSYNQFGRQQNLLGTGFGPQNFLGGFGFGLGGFGGGFGGFGGIF